MKNLLIKNTKKEELLKKFKRLSDLVGLDQNGATIKEENALVEQLEKELNFKDQEEKNQWLDICASFKFWEDFEELTLGIINREENPIKESLVDSYIEVARDICNDANFFQLFGLFSSLSFGWVLPMDKWQKHFEELKESEDDFEEFKYQFKEIYGEDFESCDIYKYHFYGFEDCPFCMFYSYSNESKEELIDCIFDRYIEFLEDGKKLYFLQSLIKGLL